MEDPNPPSDAGYYSRLETGARWLASTVVAGAEREAHLGHAERYARLAAGEGGS